MITVEIKKTNDYFEFKKIPYGIDEYHLFACFEISQFINEISDSWQKFIVDTEMHNYSEDDILTPFYKFTRI
jgi:hypothetical protein